MKAILMTSMGASMSDIMPTKARRRGVGFLDWHYFDGVKLAFPFEGYPRATTDNGSESPLTPQTGTVRVTVLTSWVPMFVDMAAAIETSIDEAFVSGSKTT